MSEINRYEPFLSDERKKFLAEDKWKPASSDYYKQIPWERRLLDWRMAEKVINLGYDFEECASGVNESHGVDFINEVIPQMMRKKKERGDNRKFKVLDLGCGLGFFNDQLRSVFGDDVEVYGTSLAKKDIRKRKIKVVQEIKEGIIPMAEKDKNTFLSQINKKLNPNDAKWASILEMRNFPEFDLIIDTCGEMLYSGKGFFPHESYSSDVLKAAICKLLPGGSFFVAITHNRDRIKYHEDNLRLTYPIDIIENYRALDETAFIITKKYEK